MSNLPGLSVSVVQLETPQLGMTVQCGYLPKSNEDNVSKHHDGDVDGDDGGGDDDDDDDGGDDDDDD